MRKPIPPVMISSMITTFIRAFPEYPVKDGKAYYDGKVEIPVEPMIGVIGVGIF